MWSHNRSHSEHVSCHISKYQAWCEPSTPRAQTEHSFLAFPEHLVIQGSHKKRMSYDVMIDPKDPKKSNLRKEAWDLAGSPSPSLSFASTSGHPRPAPLRGTKLSIIVNLFDQLVVILALTTTRLAERIMIDNALRLNQIEILFCSVERKTLLAASARLEKPAKSSSSSWRQKAMGT